MVTRSRVSSWTIADDNIYYDHAVPLSRDLRLNKGSRALYLFRMGAPRMRRIEVSPWMTREVVDFRPAGEVPATARLIVLQCSPGHWPRYKGSKLQLAKLSLQEESTTSGSKCVGSNRLKTHPSPGGRQSPRTRRRSPLLRLACRSLVPFASTPRTITPFPSSTRRS